MKNLVIYHWPCTDGFCSSWVASKKLHDVEFHGMNHGESPPNVSGKNVYIFDFSFSKEVLLKLKKEADSLILLDHHKTAKENLEGLDYCNFDISKSGARLAWDYFFPNKEPPWLVSYTEDADLNRFSLLCSREINAALNSYPKTLAKWNSLEFKDINLIIDEGRAILRSNEEMIDNLLKFQEIKIENIGGYDVPTIQSYLFRSELANILARTATFGCSWYTNKSGEKLYSLRSVGDFDVSKIAQKYGGGGHKNSAAFKIK